MNNLDHKDNRPGSDTCPSCKSALWNSAIKVVVDNTKYAKETFAATGINASKLCGSVKETLLSDRWFSWARPIAADIGLSANTGLEQEIKRFMVEYGPAVQMPSCPTEPSLSTSITDILESVEKNSPFAELLAEPSPTGIVGEHVMQKESEKSTVRYRLARFLMVIAPPLVILIGANFFFGDNFIATLPVTIFFALIMIIVTFIAQIPRVKIADDEDDPKDRENRHEMLEHHGIDTEKLEEEDERLRIGYEEPEKRLREYTGMLKKAAIYERQLAEYVIKKISVLKTRQLLWERTRICMQCGSAYLGPD